MISRLGLGTAALGRPAYITLGRDRDLGAARSEAAMQARTFAMLDAAWAAGLRYVDTARSYGQAERFVARWLAARGPAPEALTVASKWGYAYVGEWRMDAAVHEEKSHRLDRLEAQYALSSETLGAHLDLYQVHSATLDSGVLDDDAVLRRLVELRTEANLRIGLSVTGPRQADTVRRALAVEIEGAPVFSAVQATWNPLEPSVGAALAEAHAAGWRVIVKEGVANGRLTAHGQDRLPTAVGERAAAHGVGVDAWALAAALAQPWADVVLSGAVTEAQLASNLAAADMAWTPDDDDACAAIAEPPAAYWATRKALAWG